MSLEVGSVVKGKVTGVMKFGAFVALPEDKSGMVHISEISHEFVNDINDVIKVGDEVTVKVVSIDNGKISLSIKANIEKPAPKPRQRRPRKPYVPAAKEVTNFVGFTIWEIFPMTGSSNGLLI